MSFTYQVGFRANTTELSSALRTINSEIKKAFQIGSEGNGLTQQLASAVDQAQILKATLQSATTEKGLSFSKLNAELAAAGTSLQKMMASFSAAGSSFNGSMNTLLSSFSQADRSLLSISSTVKTLGDQFTKSFQFTLANQGIRWLQSQIRDTISWSKELDSTLNAIAVTTGKTGAQLDAVFDNVIAKSKELRVSAQDYIDATQIFYQQGLDDQQVGKRAEITIKAAKAAKTSVSEMSSELTAIWNTYQMSNDQLEKAAAVAAKLGASSAIKFQDIAVAMSDAASAASQMGVSYEELAAIIATVGEDTQQSASVIGNAYKTIFSRFEQLKSAGTDGEVTLGQVSKQLKDLGVNILDENGNLRDLGEVILELGNNWTNYTKKQQIAIAEAAGGTRQFGMLLALLNDFDKYKNFLNLAEIEDGTTLLKQYEATLNSVESAMTNASERWKEAFLDFFSSDNLVSFYHNLEKIGETVGSIIRSIGGLKGVLEILGAYLITKLPQGMSKLASYTKDFAANLTLTSTKQMEKIDNRIKKDIDNMRAGATQAKEIRIDAVKANTRITPEEQNRQIAQIGFSVSQDQEKLTISNQVAQAMARINQMEREGDTIAQQKAATYRDMVSSAQQLANSAADRLKSASEELMVLEREATVRQQRAAQNNNEEVSRFDMSFEGADQKATSFNQTLANISTQLLKIKQSGQGLQELGPLFENLAAAADPATKTGAALSDLTQKYLQLKDAEGEFITGTSAQEFALKALGEIAEAVIADISQLDQADQEAASGARKLAEIMMILVSAFSDQEIGAERVRVATNRLNLAYSQTAMSARAFGQALTGTLSSAGMLTISIKGLNSAIKEGNWGNLLLQIGMVSGSLSSLLPSIAQLIKGFSNIGEILITAGASLVSFIAEAWPILLIIGIVAGLTVAFVKLNEAIKSNSIAGKIEQAKKETQFFKDELISAKNATEELKSSLESLDSIYEKIDKLKQGTAEFAQAVLEANQEVMKLLELYGMLSPENYTKDENGVYHIPETAQQEMERRRSQYEGLMAIRESQAARREAALEAEADYVELGMSLHLPATNESEVAELGRYFVDAVKKYSGPQFAEIVDDEGAITTTSGLYKSLKEAWEKEFGPAVEDGPIDIFKSAIQSMIEFGSTPDDPIQTAVDLSNRVVDLTEHLKALDLETMAYDDNILSTIETLGLSETEFGSNTKRFLAAQIDLQELEEKLTTVSKKWETATDSQIKDKYKQISGNALTDEEIEEIGIDKIREIVSGSIAFDNLLRDEESQFNKNVSAMDSLKETAEKIGVNLENIFPDGKFDPHRLSFTEGKQLQSKLSDVGVSTYLPSNSNWSLNDLDNNLSEDSIFNNLYNKSEFRENLSQYLADALIDPLNYLETTLKQSGQTQLLQDFGKAIADIEPSKAAELVQDLTCFNGILGETEDLLVKYEDLDIPIKKMIVYVGDLKQMGNELFEKASALQSKRKELVDTLISGGSIEEKEIKNLGDNFSSFLISAGNGMYKLAGDAEQFANAVQSADIENLLSGIGHQQGKIDFLQTQFPSAEGIEDEKVILNKDIEQVLSQASNLSELESLISRVEGKLNGTEISAETLGKAMLTLGASLGDCKGEVYALQRALQSGDEGLIELRTNALRASIAASEIATAFDKTKDEVEHTMSNIAKDFESFYRKIGDDKLAERFGKPFSEMDKSSQRTLTNMTRKVYGLQKAWDNYADLLDDITYLYQDLDKGVDNFSQEGWKGWSVVREQTELALNTNLDFLDTLDDLEKSTAIEQITKQYKKLMEHEEGAYDGLETLVSYYQRTVDKMDLNKLRDSGHEINDLQGAVQNRPESGTPEEKQWKTAIGFKDDELQAYLDYIESLKPEIEIDSNVSPAMQEMAVFKGMMTSDLNEIKSMLESEFHMEVDVSSASMSLEDFKRHLSTIGPYSEEQATRMFNAFAADTTMRNYDVTDGTIQDYPNVTVTPIPEGETEITGTISGGGEGGEGGNSNAVTLDGNPIGTFSGGFSMTVQGWKWQAQEEEPTTAEGEGDTKRSIPMVTHAGEAPSAPKTQDIAEDHTPKKSGGGGGSGGGSPGGGGGGGGGGGSTTKAYKYKPLKKFHSDSQKTKNRYKDLERVIQNSTKVVEKLSTLYTSEEAKDNLTEMVKLKIKENEQLERQLGYYQDMREEAMQARAEELQFLNDLIAEYNEYRVASGLSAISWTPEFDEFGGITNTQELAEMLDSQMTSLISQYNAEARQNNDNAFQSLTYQEAEGGDEGEEPMKPEEKYDELIALADAIFSQVSAVNEAADKLAEINQKIAEIVTNQVARISFLLTVLNSRISKIDAGIDKINARQEKATGLGKLAYSDDLYQKNLEKLEIQGVILQRQNTELKRYQDDFNDAVWEAFNNPDGDLRDYILGGGAKWVMAMAGAVHAYQDEEGNIHYLDANDEETDYEHALRLHGTTHKDGNDDYAIELAATYKKLQEDPTKWLLPPGFGKTFGKEAGAVFANEVMQNPDAYNKSVSANFGKSGVGAIQNVSGVIAPSTGPVNLGGTTYVPMIGSSGRASSQNIDFSSTAASVGARLGSNSSGFGTSTISPNFGPYTAPAIGSTGYATAYQERARLKLGGTAINEYLSTASGEEAERLIDSMMSLFMYTTPNGRHIVQRVVKETDENGNYVDKNGNIVDTWEEAAVKTNDAGYAVYEDIGWGKWISRDEEDKQWILAENAFEDPEFLEALERASFTFPGDLTDMSPQELMEFEDFLQTFKDALPGGEAWAEIMDLLTGQIEKIEQQMADIKATEAEIEKLKQSYNFDWAQVDFSKFQSEVDVTTSWFVKLTNSLEAATRQLDIYSNNMSFLGGRGWAANMEKAMEVNRKQIEENNKMYQEAEGHFHDSLEKANDEFHRLAEIYGVQIPDAIGAYLENGLWQIDNEEDVIKAQNQAAKKLEAPIMAFTNALERIAAGHYVVQGEYGPGGRQSKNGAGIILDTDDNGKPTGINAGIATELGWELTSDGNLKNPFFTEGVQEVIKNLYESGQIEQQVYDILKEEFITPEVLKTLIPENGLSDVIANFKTIQDNVQLYFDDGLNWMEKAKEAADKMVESFDNVRTAFEEWWGKLMESVNKRVDLRDQIYNLKSNQADFIQSFFSTNARSNENRKYYLERAQAIGQARGSDKSDYDALMGYIDKFQAGDEEAVNYFVKEFGMTREQVLSYMQEGFLPQEVEDRIVEFTERLQESQEELLEMSRGYWEAYLGQLSAYVEDFGNLMNDLSTYTSVLSSLADTLANLPDFWANSSYNSLRQLSDTLTITQGTNAYDMMNIAQSGREKAAAILKEFEGRDLSKLTEAESEKYSQALIAYQQFSEQVQENMQTFVESAVGMYESYTRELDEDTQEKFSELSEAANGAFRYWEDAQEMYDLKKQLDDFYLDDEVWETGYAGFEKFTKKGYELESLERQINDITKDITDSSRLNSYMKILDEINDIKASGRDITQTEVDILKQKIAVEQAYDAQLNAQDNKNTMRLARDQSGNWNYVYSMDDETDYTQKIADEVNALYEATKQAEEEFSTLWLTTRTGWESFMEGVNRDRMLTDAKYRQEIEQISEWYAELQHDQAGEIMRYNNELGHSFAETTLGFIVQSDNIIEKDAELTTQFQVCADEMLATTQELQEQFDGYIWKMMGKDRADGAEGFAGLEEISNKMTDEIQNKELPRIVDGMKSTKEGFEEQVGQFNQVWKTFEGGIDSIVTYMNDQVIGDDGVLTKTLKMLEDILARINDIVDATLGDPYFNMFDFGETGYDVNTDYSLLGAEEFRRYQETLGSGGIDFKRLLTGTETERYTDEDLLDAVKNFLYDTSFGRELMRQREKAGKARFGEDWENDLEELMTNWLKEARDYGYKEGSENPFFRVFFGEDSTWSEAAGKSVFNDSNAYKGSGVTDMDIYTDYSQAIINDFVTKIDDLKKSGVEDIVQAYLDSLDTTLDIREKAALWRGVAGDREKSMEQLTYLLTKVLNDQNPDSWVRNPPNYGGTSRVTDLAENIRAIEQKGLPATPEDKDIKVNTGETAENTETTADNSGKIEGDLQEGFKQEGENFVSLENELSNNLDENADDIITENEKAFQAATDEAKKNSQTEILTATNLSTEEKQKLHERTQAIIDEGLGEESPLTRVEAEKLRYLHEQLGDESQGWIYLAEKHLNNLDWIMGGSAESGSTGGLYAIISDTQRMVNEISENLESTIKVSLEDIYSNIQQISNNTQTIADNTMSSAITSAIQSALSGLSGGSTKNLSQAAYTVPIQPSGVVTLR